MALASTLKGSGVSSRRSTLSRRDRRKLETRQALLDATHTLLASRNLDALSVDEIAMRADVAKGTFYNYFADKDALARELAARPGPDGRLKSRGPTPRSRTRSPEWRERFVA
ncbi:MAG TPA: helix-turn-helix domain-containing protein [Candidatus Binataceae bacterium]|jgi:hypothetical protein